VRRREDRCVHLPRIEPGVPRRELRRRGRDAGRNVRRRWSLRRDAAPEVRALHLRRHRVQRQLHGRRRLRQGGVLQRQRVRAEARSRRHVRRGHAVRDRSVRRRRLLQQRVRRSVRCVQRRRLRGHLLSGHGSSARRPRGVRGKRRVLRAVRRDDDEGLPNAGSEKICSKASCLAGVGRAAGRCDGSGTCDDSVPPVSCGAYACSGSACGTSCSDDASCAPFHVCNGNKCVPGGGAPDGGADGSTDASAHAGADAAPDAHGSPAPSPGNDAGTVDPLPGDSGSSCACSEVGAGAPRSPTWAGLGFASLLATAFARRRRGGVDSTGEA